MRAVLQRRYGPARDVLEIGEAEPPAVGPRDVLVDVDASCVHADVWHVVTGLPYVIRLGSGLVRPRNPIPGTDVAGVVAEVGSEVTRFSRGDRVFGETVGGYQWKNGGAWAERASVPEDDLAPVPDGVGLAEAATVPTSGLIALLNMDYGDLVPRGGRVLVNGAAGGVGAIALQLACAFGAEVTAVDSGAKLRLLLELGADHVVDYETEDPLADRGRYDLIYDVASVLPLARVKPALREGGRYARIGHMHYEEERSRWFGNLPGFAALMVRASYDPLLTDFPDARPGALDVLAEHLASGALTPVVARRFALEEAADAIEVLKTGIAPGRLVLQVREPTGDAPAP